MPIAILLALWAQVGSPAAPLATVPSPAQQPRVARFSFYPIRLYDLSPQAGVFSADFYFWLSLPKKKESAPKLESANGEELQCEVVEYDPPTSPDTQTFWYRCRSKFYHSFNFAFYPFDEQPLTIRLESPEFPKADFSFEVMTPASHVGECTSEGCMLNAAAHPTVSGWEVSWAAIRTDVHTYATDWGFPSYKSLSEYSQAVLEIRLLHRWEVPLLALLAPNLLVGLLATLLAGSSQERAGRMQALLGVTAAAAAQHYGFMSNAPGESILSFAQLYFVLAYGILALAGWFILTRENPLPPNYQARWFLGYGGLIVIFFAIHIAMPPLLHSTPTR